VAAVGQGGLLDVALDPDFARNRLVYLSFAEPHEGGRNATAVWRAEFSDLGLSKGRVIFSQRPAIASGQHFGSRLVFDRGGRLFITTGDRGSQKQQAQTLDNHIGKVLRIERDGQVPADNPFVARKDALPEIWSYGHRNMQGAALHPQTGVLWTHEHGARGGDEVNLTLPGRNYGWPIITWGVDYSGEAIGEGGEKVGMEQPLKHWEPSIAPSGMAFYTGKPFVRWEGSLLVGALAGQRLVRLILADNRITGEEILLRELQRRIRDVRVGPDGLIYLLTDHPDGTLLRVSPLAPRQP
jgi:glucose/arabinose dehydrogenase